MSSVGLRVPLLPARLLALLLRGVAAVIVAYTVYELVGEAIVLSIGVLPPSYNLASLAPASSLLGGNVGLIFSILTALAVLLGRYAAGILVPGLVAAYVYALGGSIPSSLLAAVIFSLTAPVLERRFTLMDGSGVRVQKETSSTTLFAMIGYYVILVLAALGMYFLGEGLGAAFAQLLVPRNIGGLSLLASLASQTVLLRIALLVLLVWIVYKISSQVAEPIFFAVFASRDAVRQLVDRMIAEERKRIEKGEAWYQKLFFSSLSHVAGIISFLVVYGAVRVVSLLLALLASSQGYASTPLLSMLLDTPILAGLVGYYVGYRLAKSRIAKSMYNVSPPSLKKSIVLMVLLALALYASGTLVAFLIQSFKCALLGSSSCILVADTGLAAQIDSIIVSSMRLGAEGLREAALFINYIVKSLFG